MKKVIMLIIVALYIAGVVLYKPTMQIYNESVHTDDVVVSEGTITNMDGFDEYHPSNIFSSAHTDYFTAFEIDVNSEKINITVEQAITTTGNNYHIGQTVKVYEYNDKYALSMSEALTPEMNMIVVFIIGGFLGILTLFIVGKDFVRR